MHPDDLKAIWVCHECQTIFLFLSDTDKHKSLTGHEVFEKRGMISLAAEKTLVQ